MRLPALEKNILKYRALEMTIILFHAESLKRFIVDSIRATDDLHHKFDKRPHRIPNGTKKVLKKAFDILVQDEILTQDESDEMQELIPEFCMQNIPSIPERHFIDAAQPDPCKTCRVNLASRAGFSRSNLS